MAASSSVAGPERWVVIYPPYINANKKIVEGRRISKTASVTDPTIDEIIKALKLLGLRYKDEPTKCYSRDSVFEIGRIRVELFKQTDEPINPEIPSRMFH